tara:strand:- start:38 stop:766 length:729 start_codon:yes stop_codon:yes gene_type:complete
MKKLDKKLYIAAPFGNYLTHKNATSVIGTFTLNKRTGLLKQIVKTLRYSYKDKCWYNALGLRNPGIIDGIGKYKPDNILSIAAIDAGDWLELEHLVPKDIKLELNISCPNIEHYNQYTNGIEKFVNRDPIIKLSPNMALKDIDRLYEQGFRKFHACNTFKTDKGGRSGKYLKVFTEKFIKHLKQTKKDIYCIAGGGIETMQDIREYHSIGADAFSLGTVCFNPFKKNHILNNYPIDSWRDYC